MELDDETGARLRSLADAGRNELDTGAQERIARRIASEGPRVVRRARQRRIALRVGGALCVAGLAFALYVRVPSAELQTTAVTGARATKHEPARPAQAPAQSPALALNAAPACASRNVPELAPSALPQREADASRASAGAQRFELGSIAAIVADAGSALWLDARDPCRLKLRLLDGQVSVHAADLGGGELRVVTASGDVVVHGTRFSVRHAHGALTVDVAEGRVALQRAGHDLVPAIAAGQRLHADAGAAPVLTALPDAARAELLAALAAPSAAPAMNASAAATQPTTQPASPAATALRRNAESLVHEADALWRSGDLERARTRYREAGGLHGPTAEAAWLALARRELSAGRIADAQAALDGYGAHFGSGSAARGGLAAEAAGIEFRVGLESGDERATRRAAETLQRRYASTPQAAAALRWLEAHGRHGR